MALPEEMLAPIRASAALALGTALYLDSEQAQALRFRQLNAKEAFTLVDAKGVFWRASLTALSASHAEAKVYERMARSPESPVELTLICAVLARQRMLTVIQKATELGASCVLPVLSEHSVKAEGLEHEKAHAWPAQALRAARQCRRASIPDVRPAMALAAALRDPVFCDADRRYFLDDRTESDKPVGGEASKPARIAFVVGPEGGFSEAERQMLRAAGASSLQLGGRVLRAETAALVGLALLQHHYGDL
jgi:16S rRNA (uracil1498-N3)-methyltransferase